MSAAVYWMVVSSFRGIFLPGARLHVRREAEFPRGPFLLASNHISHFDPPLLSVASPIRIDWMAMREILEVPVGGAILRGTGAFPVERGGDRASVREALRRLKGERVVGVFPEGGIRDGSASILNGAPIRAGATALAAMAGVPVVPAVILGSDRLYRWRNWKPWHRVPIWIRFGPPIAPPGATGEDRADRQAYADALAAEMRRLCAATVAEFGLDAQDLPAPPRRRMEAW